MANKKSHDEFITDLIKVNPDIICLDQYINSGTSISFQHKLCGHIWIAAPNDILRGTGCPKCAKGYRLSHNEFIQRLFNVNPEITLLSEYKKTHDNVLVQHSCGYQWTAQPANLLSGKGCPKCAGVLRKTNYEFETALLAINPNIRCLEKYGNVKTKLLFIDDSCGHTWRTTPNSIIKSKTGCPICRESHGEREIRNWLLFHNISFVSQKKFDGCTNKSALPFDFYIEKYNTCIEFQGIQHYAPVEFFGGMNSLLSYKHCDNIKRRFCQENNIKLLTIKYNQDVDTILSETFQYQNPYSMSIKNMVLNTN